MRALLCLTLFTLGCYSAPLPTPADDVTDGGPCGGACGAGTVCVAGACAVADAGARDAGIAALDVPAVDLGGPVDAGVDAGVDVPAVDVGVDTGPADALPAGCVSTTPGNCCGVACPAPANGTALCGGGRCGIASCAANYGDCDGNTANGCETDTRRSAANCGACGAACTTGRACVAGACVTCSSGLALCPDGCVDVRSDAANCGGCGPSFACVVRSGGSARCSGGVCSFVCNAPNADCDGQAINGCEVDTALDRAHCGRCNTPCVFGQTCVSGRCR